MEKMELSYSSEHTRYKMICSEKRDQNLRTIEESLFKTDKLNNNGINLIRTTVELIEHFSILSQPAHNL